MDLTSDDVAEILTLLDSLPYDELDVETTRFRLTLRRAPGGGWTQEHQVLAEPIAVTPGAAAAESGASAADGAPSSAVPADADRGTGGTADAAPDADGLVAVTAPLPGTFYRAPRPGADPFVREGDAVSPDTVVAIVETMKLMNSVHAGTAGRVARICADNGEFTPLGSILLLIEPDA
jgi:acetyl-CoA carboxylase biotin carboxyl carrier protein